MNGHSLLLHSASHLFNKSVSCRSAKLTTGNSECVVRLKKFTLQKKKKHTMTSPDGLTDNQIDHILIDKRRHSSCETYQLERGVQVKGV